MAFDKFARDAVVVLKAALNGVITNSAYRPTPEAGSDLPNGAYYTSVDPGDGLQYRYQRTSGGLGYTRGRLVYSKADVGLPQADNTSDANKPVSDAQAAALAQRPTRADLLSSSAAMALGAAGGWTVEDGLSLGIPLRLTAAASSTDTSAAASNSAKLAAAIAALKATASAPGMGNRTTLRRHLYERAGLFLFDPTVSHVIDFPGFGLKGAGLKATTFYWDGTGTNSFLDMGAFNATPTSDLFNGGGYSYTIEDLTFARTGTTQVGSRQGIALRDNGSGDGRVRNVVFRNFKVGYCQTFGSDFTETKSCAAEYCDVGLYMGPGSQQVVHDSWQSQVCREGIVFDRPGQVLVLKPTLNNSFYAQLVFEIITQASTRYCSAIAVSSIFYEQQIVIESPWLESNAGPMGDAGVPDYHIVHNNNGSDAYRGIHVRNPQIVSGRSLAGDTNKLVGDAPSVGKKTIALVANIGAYPPLRSTITDAIFQGYMDYWSYGPFSSGFIFKNARPANGSTAPANTNNPNSSPVFINEETRKTNIAGNFTASTVLNQWNNGADTEGVRTRYAGGDTYAIDILSGGTWYTVSERATARPTSGSYKSGCVVTLTNAITLTTGEVITGYTRATLGNNHVLNVDWVANKLRHNAADATPDAIIATVGSPDPGVRGYWAWQNAGSPVNRAVQRGFRPDGVEAVTLDPNGGIRAAVLTLAGVGGYTSTGPFPGAPSTGISPYFETDSGRLRVITAGGLGRSIPVVITGTKVYDPPSVAAGGTFSTTVTVTGAVLGDIVSGVSFSPTGGFGGLMHSESVSAADTVEIVFFNPTAGPIDRPSGNLRADVYH